MKLNFLKVLNTNKSSTDEIAGEIAALEQKQRECGQEYAAIVEQAKSLRSRKLCGEGVSEADIRDADRKVESARLDSEAISETIARLKEKLRDAFQVIKDGSMDEIRSRRALIENERKKALEEIAKGKARLVASAEVYVGACAEQLARSGHLFDYDPETQELYLSELSRLRSQTKKPTYQEKKQEIDQYSRWTVAMNVDDEVARSIERHREIAPTPDARADSHLL